MFGGGYYGYTHEDFHVPRAFYRFGPFQLVTVVAAVALLVVVLAAVVTLLLYVADLAEEYPSYTRRALAAVVVFSLGAHALILLIDRLSWWRSLVSIAVNVCYLRILRTFPFVRGAGDPRVVAAAVGLVVESAAWYTLCMELLFYTPLWQITAFYGLMWSVPVVLACACATEDDQLPVGGGRQGRAGRDGSSTSSRSFLRRIVDTLS